MRFGVAGENVKLWNDGTGAVGSVKNLGGTQGSINGTAVLNDALVNLASKGNPYGALGMTLAKGADYVLNLELSALQDEGKGEITFQSPSHDDRYMCLTIKQGTQFPYQTSSANTGTNIEFKEATLTLDVTPQITPSGSIIMDLAINKDAVGNQLQTGIEKLIPGK